MYISDAQSTAIDVPLSAKQRHTIQKADDHYMNDLRPRSYSLNAYEQPRAKELVERMKHTYEYKVNEHKGYDSYKGNIRSATIQAPFVTLEDRLRKLPKSISFDIEISQSIILYISNQR